MRHRAPVHRPPTRSDGSVVGYALLAAAAIALSTWQAQLSRDSPGARWSVALLLGAAIVLAIILGRRRQRQTTPAWVASNARVIWTWRSQPSSAIVSVLIWTMLIAGVVGWDVTSFIFQSHMLPTLSYFIGHVTRSRFGRGLIFALWLGVGWYLVTAWRAETPR